MIAGLKRERTLGTESAQHSTHHEAGQTLAGTTNIEAFAAHRGSYGLGLALSAGGVHLGLSCKQKLYKPVTD